VRPDADLGGELDEGRIADVVGDEHPARPKVRPGGPIFAQLGRVRMVRIVEEQIDGLHIAEKRRQHFPRAPEQECPAIPELRWDGTARLPPVPVLDSGQIDAVEMTPIVLAHRREDRRSSEAERDAGLDYDVGSHQRDESTKEVNKFLASSPYQERFGGVSFGRPERRNSVLIGVRRYAQGRRHRGCL
jgi:hypothetical protein